MYIVIQSAPSTNRASLNKQYFKDLPLIVTVPHLLAETYRAGETETRGIPIEADVPDSPSLGNPALTGINESLSRESKFDLLLSNGAEDDEVFYELTKTESPPGDYNDNNQLAGAVVPGDPNLPTERELNEYILNNYRTNLERGMSRFSLHVTEAMLEQGPLVSRCDVRYSSRDLYIAVRLIVETTLNVSQLSV